jgi:probable rRNA maturation factor
VWPLYRNSGTLDEIRDTASDDCGSIKALMITLELPRTTTTEREAWQRLGVSRVALMRFLGEAQSTVRVKGEVAVLLAGDATLRRLNKQFRGKDKATDVLSFPPTTETRAKHGGDLAISFETAQRQADEHGHSLIEELRVLMLHGLLHLAGMDHETDDGEMAEREAKLRKKLKLPVGLIARTHEVVAR